MSIRVDFTQHSSVAVCSACGWRDVATTRTDAWRLARAHEQRAHPGASQAARALDTLVRAATR